MDGAVNSEVMGSKFTLPIENDLIVTQRLYKTVLDVTFKESVRLRFWVI